MSDLGASQTLTVSVWLTIDGALDNAIWSLIDDGHGLDAPEVTRAQALRERGWAVNRQHPERGLGPVGWPPREAWFDIALSESYIGYIVSLLTHDLGVTARILASGGNPSIRQLEEALVLTQEALDALR